MTPLQRCCQCILQPQPTGQLVKWAIRIGNRRTSGNHQKYSIVMVGGNTEKSPRDLKRLVVTQSSVKDHQLTIFTNPSSRVGYDTRSVFKRSLTGLNSEFSFSQTSCLTKAEEHSLPYYLPIAGGRITGFILFPRILVLCEIQLVSSRIWTSVAVSDFYDDKYYTTSTSVNNGMKNSQGVIK